MSAFTRGSVLAYPFAYPFACAFSIAFAFPAQAQSQSQTGEPTPNAKPAEATAPSAPAAPVTPAPPSSSASTTPASTPAPASSSAPASPSASASSAVLASPEAIAISPTGVGKRYTTWDLNIDGAYGRLFTDPSRGAGFGRIRAGVMWIRDPVFLSIGATYELSNFSNATLGVQAEWLNLEIGIWAQAGALVDVDGGARLGVMGAVGWSVVGVEVQGRDVAGSGFVPAFFAKLRIPISIIAFGIRGR